MPFERSYIFLDTNIYVQEAYRFDGKSLGKLASISSDDELRLVVPEIIQLEVAYRIREVAEEHVTRILNAHGSSIIGLISDRDRNSTGLDVELDAERIIGSIAGTWEKFCTRCNAEYVSLSAIDLPDVVSSYFNARPPFGKGRKRNEFPDAFAVVSMLAFANERPNRPIYVVSRDNGMLEAFCKDPRFQCHKELSEVLDEYNRHTEALSPAAHNLMEENIDWISEVIVEGLQANPAIYASGYPLDRMHVEAVDIDIDEINLVEIGLDRALFDVGLSYLVDAEVIEMVPVGYDDHDWEVIPRRFRGQTTAYLEVLTNDNFSELNEIASVEF